MKKAFRLFLTGVVLMSFLLGLAIFGVNQFLVAPGPLQNPIAVVVEPGDGSATIADKLIEHDVIDDSWAFRMAVRLKGLAQSLKAGEYHFEPGISMRSAIKKLVRGDAEARSVTIPEGYTVFQVIETLAINDALKGDPLRVPEGHLFPDTYHFSFGSSRKELMQSMQKRMDDELAEAWQNRQPGLPYASPEELLTMASIVQKEAASEEEMPRIASVFVNRLKQGMKLQSDPTVIYGIDFQKGAKLRKKDLTEPHPFNTYVHLGLPPTPIANPGRQALQAAAHPAEEKYLYFVADPARTHHVFSKTYDEHRRNVARYWKLVDTLSPTTRVTSPTQGPIKGK